MDRKLDRARRLLWWIVAYERPTWVGDYAAILGLVLLLLLGALALSWPWVSEAGAGAVAAGLAAIGRLAAAWLHQVGAALARSG